MELCDNGHDEVCFDGRECPACAAQELVSGVREAVEDLDVAGLDLVDEGLGTLADTLKTTAPLMEPLDALLLSLRTATQQLTPPWHNKTSFDAFCAQVAQLDTLLIAVNAIQADRFDIVGWSQVLQAISSRISSAQSEL